jgi:hypothetical protein
MSIAKWLAVLVALMLPGVALSQDKAQSQEKAPAASAATPAKPPEGRVLEALVKTTLLSFNDAVMTGDYSVFHAKLSKPFRQQFTQEKLAQSFASFAEKGVDIGIISTFPPTFDSPPSIDSDGRLLVKGYFPTEPSRCYFDLKFIPGEGSWKLIAINVNVKKPE